MISNISSVNDISSDSNSGYMRDDFYLFGKNLIPLATQGTAEMAGKTKIRENYCSKQKMELSARCTMLNDSKRFKW